MNADRKMIERGKLEFISGQHINLARNDHEFLILLKNIAAGWPLNAASTQFFRTFSSPGK
jgi:hypothetical protein